MDHVPALQCASTYCDDIWHHTNWYRTTCLACAIVPADIIDHVHMTVCSSQKSMLQIKFLIANCVPCDYTMTIETGQPQKREHCA